MNYFKIVLSAHSIVIISLLLCSCGTKHSIKDEFIYKDDNFTYHHLMNNGLVVGGVASQNIFITNDERIQYGSHLSTIIIKEHKDLNIINTSQLMYKIGKENYFSIMKYFDVNKILGNENMRVIKELFPEFEYIILTYIENEYIRNESHTEETADDEGKYKTVYKTTYSLAVEFQIYDVFKEQLVWNNILYNEAVKTQSRTEDSFLGVVIGDAMSGAYVTIDREDVLEEMYEKFAEDLVKLEN
jgi:hypothetical protein